MGKKIKTPLRGRKIKCQNFLCSDFGSCLKYADAHHHLFSNDTRKGGNRAIYGDLIDEDFNIIFINNDCHTNKVIPKLSEIQFRELAIECGYTNLPMSKTLAVKRFKTDDELLEESYADTVKRYGDVMKKLAEL